MVSPQNSCLRFVIMTKIKQLFRQFNNNLFTMVDADNNDTAHHHYDVHAVDWDDDTDMMAAAVLVVVNTNTAIMNCCIELAHEEQQEQVQLQLMNDILTPNQAYRHKPRQPKAIFRHHEALWCIQRDYLGIPVDSDCHGLGFREFLKM